MSNISKNNSIEEKSFDFFIKNINEYLPYVILNSFGSIFGVIGSIAIVTAILITKELQTRMNLIIANIALVDFILSTLVDSFAIAGLF
jgi:hypothetical protein